MIEKIYLPQRRDLVYGLQNQRVVLSHTDSVASGDFSTIDFYTVPSNYVMQINGVVFYLEGGGTQYALHAILRADVDGTTMELAAATQRNSQRPDMTESVVTDVLLMEDDALSIRGIYSAGVSVNILKATVWGVMYPRANIQPSSAVSL